ncbi:MAG TPA: PAS domain S-box protein [Blastocatellia bacterium]|nr:PAS domain S-box protein [Blastocatellia bacterium]
MANKTVSEEPVSEPDWFAIQLRRLELVAALLAKHESATSTLDALMQELARALNSDLNSVHVLNGSGQYSAGCVSAGLSDDFSRAVANEMLPAAAGSVVVVDDTRRHPRWTGLLSLTEAAGVRAAWSVPIVSPSGQVIGSFSTYYRQPRLPDVREIETARIYAACAAIAIQNQHLSDQFEESRTELRSIIEQMPEGVFIARAPDGAPLLMNRVGNKLLGNPPGGITVKDYPRYVTLEYSDGTIVPTGERPVSRALRGQSARNSEFTSRTPDGKSRNLLINYAPLHGSGGVIFGAIVVFRDISDQKRAEEAVRRSEERYRTLVEQASVGIFITDLDTRYLEANTTGCAILGYTREELLAKSLPEIVYESDAGIFGEAFQKVVQGDPALLELRLKRQCGSLVRAEVSAKLMPESRVLVITRDITDRKRTEEELQRQETLLRGVTAATSALLTVPDQDAGLIEALAKLGQACGAHRAYIFEARNEAESVNPIFLPRYQWVGDNQIVGTDSPRPALLPTRFEQSRLYGALSGGVSVNGLVADLCPGEKVDREITYALSVLFTPIFIGSDFWGFIGFEDWQLERHWSENEESILRAAAVTIGAAIERRRAAAALRDSEERFSKAFNANPNPTSITSLDTGHFIAVNNGFTRVFGYSREEAIGRTTVDLRMWTSVEQRDQIIQLLRAHEEIRDLEVTFVTKSGEPRLFLLSAEIIVLGDQQCILSVTTDITRRKRAEEELRESEKRFSIAFNESPLPMSILTLKGGRYIDVNDAFVNVVGCPREEIIGRTSIELGVWANPEEHRTVVKALFETGFVRDMEVRFNVTGGGVCVGLFSAELIDLGGDKCVLTTTNDITERKEREEELLAVRREWQTTFDAMTDNVILVGPDDRLIRANRAFYQKTGLLPDECIGTPIRDLLHRPGSRLPDGKACPVCELRCRGERAALEFPAGVVTSFPMFASIDPIVDASGKLVGVVQVVRDLSDLYRAREEAERERTSLIATIEQMAEGLIVCNERSEVIHANRHAQEIFGFNLEQMRSDRDASLPRARFFDSDGRLCEVGELPIQVALARQVVVDSHRLWYDRPDGRRLLLSVTASPFLSEHGRLAGAVALVRDVTEQQREHERSQQADKLRALGQLASGVAHNFNNALASVIGYTQLGQRKVRDIEVQTYLSVIEQSAKDAARMVERIQNFSRRGSRAEDFVALPVAEVVRDAVEITRPRWCYDAGALGIKYEVALALEEVEDLAVRGEPSELREVFVNIIFNALDAMPNGGALRITASGDGSTVTIAFADNGAGMTPEIKRRVFEPFFTTKGVAGLGMGMSESYRIIERHEGRIDIESQLHHGSTFTVVLPVGAPADPSPVVTELPATYPAARVLVVDDEEAVRKVLAAMLQEMGHEVTQASSAEEGIAIFETRPFDIVFTDLAMPKVDGVAAAIAMKSRRPEVKVVVISGYGVERAYDRAGDTNVIDSALRKPFSFAELQDVLQELMKTGRTAAT